MPGWLAGFLAFLGRLLSGGAPAAAPAAELLAAWRLLLAAAAACWRPPPRLLGAALLRVLPCVRARADRGALRAARHHHNAG
eukprot:SAG25_NODE_3999_length_910_cov_1.209618_1_plen_82_part_00